MADVRVKLLGDVNGDFRSLGTTLVPRYIATISAEQLATLLKYRRQKGKHPIRLEPDSTIQVDEEVQRGKTDVGTLRQEDKKIDEIRDGLLGAPNAAPKVFLGSLIWNVREATTGTFRKLLVSEEGKPPEYELAIKAPAIYLTDSAHRHFGIAEAHRQFSQDPGKFPRFRPEYQFSVEIYNLDRSGERLLFNELNAKQKKITAAKQQQVDATSDIGVLKDRIATMDLEEGRLLYQNIEVNSNTNDRHTLMTMSVFTSSIREMFGGRLIQEAAKDDELRDELAQYYCDFLYKLRDTIRTQVTINGRVEEISPFSNLYTEIISPAENEAAELEEDAQDQVLHAARERAKRRNADIRTEEKVHSNSFLKAVAFIGGQIRLMKDWEQVVDQIQSKLIAGASGRYFQKSNQRLTTPNDRGIAIGVVKEDGTLNVQVQTHIILEIKRLLMDELDLAVRQTLHCVVPTGAYELSAAAPTRVFMLSRIASNRVEFILDFVVGSEVVVEKSALRLRVSPELIADAWKDGERKGEKRLVPHEVIRVDGWAHPTYGDSLAKYSAVFVLETPAFARAVTDTFVLKLEATAYDISGQEAQATYVLTCQAQ